MVQAQLSGLQQNPDMQEGIGLDVLRPFILMHLHRSLTFFSSSSNAFPPFFDVAN